MIVRLFDKRDFDLWVIKALCVTLTILTVCGYMDAVSEIEFLFNVHIMFFALILLTITTLGFCVFHVRLRTDNSSDATLFNHFSVVMALAIETRACLLVILITDQVWTWLGPASSQVIKFIIMILTLVGVFNIVGVTCCILIKISSPTLYLRVSQSWISPKIILIVEIVALFLTFVAVFGGCDGDLSCIKTILFPSIKMASLVSTGILILLTNTVHKFIRRLGNMTGRLFGLANSPPLGQEDEAERQVIVIISPLYQRQLIF